MAQIRGARAPSSSVSNRRGSDDAGAASSTPYQYLGDRKLAAIRDNLDRRPYPPPSFVKIGGQWYRQVDNGVQNTLVPVAEPWVSEEELAARRAAIERARYIAENPYAGVADVTAAMFGASPETRERLVMAAGAVNDIAVAAAPFGSRARNAPKAPPRPKPMEVAERPSIGFGPVNSSGQSSYGEAIVAEPMLGLGKKANRRMTLPGMGTGRNPDYQRGHLIGNVVGGTANTPREAMALDKWANRRMYHSFERPLKARALDGGFFNYRVVPSYNSPGTEPDFVTLTASGPYGELPPTIIFNPKTPRR